MLQSQTVLGAVQTVDISNNAQIGVEGAQAFATFIPAAQALQWLIVGPKATRIPVHDPEVTTFDLSDEDLGVCEAVLVAAAILTLENVVSVNLSNCPRLAGATKSNWMVLRRRYTWASSTADSDLSGLKALCKAWQTRATLTAINLR